MEHHHSFLAEPRLWVAVAFVIFFVVFGKRLWVPLVAILDKRTESIRAELAEATRLRQEAEAMLRDAVARRDAAIADAQALLEGAASEAGRVTRAAAADASSAAARRERMALDRIAAAEKAALRDVQLAAADIATRAAQALLSGGGVSGHEAELIDRAIAGVPAALGGRAA
jgi:F-type H+-transporting ATPase subunit b